MVQVNGIREPVQRLSRERTGKVKYSTSCPRRRVSPSEARRAMPTSFRFESGKIGREAMIVFAFYSPKRLTSQIGLVNNYLLLPGTCLTITRLDFERQSVSGRGCQWVLDAACQAVEWPHQSLRFESPHFRFSRPTFLLLAWACLNSRL